MLAATTTFAQALARWADAIEQGNINTARAIARQIEVSGKELAVHPDFHRCIEKHFYGMGPDQLVRCVSQFLVCATDAREWAIKQNGSRD